MKKRQRKNFYDYQSLELRQLLAADAPAVMAIGATNIGGTLFNDFYFDDDRDTDVEIDRLFGISSQTMAVSGDWDGNGSTDIGVVYEDAGFWHWLLDTDGDPDVEIDTIFGLTSDIPVVGDWDGNGTTTLGVARPEGSFYRWLYDSDFDPDVEGGNFIFGGPFFGDKPVTGDWNGDGTWDVGVARPDGGLLRWYYDFNQDPNVEGGDFLFGLDSDTPVPGDFDNDGSTNPTVVRPIGGLLNWFVDTNEDQNPEQQFQFGLPGHIPIAGEWQLSEAELRDGGTIVASPQTVELGNGLAGSLPSSKAFTIVNQGTANLTISGVTVPGGFTISGLPNSLAPNASANFTISVDPSTAGNQSGSLTFATNDGNENVLEFQLSELSPEIAVSDVSDGGAFDFGFGFQGQTIEHEFTISNSGNADLSVSNPSVTGPFFQVGAFPTTIAAGGSATFTLGVNSASSGNLSGSFRFDSNDSSETPFDFSLSASLESTPSTTGGDTPAVMAIGTVDVGGTLFNEFYFDTNQEPTTEIDRLFGISTYTLAVSGDWDGNGSTDIGVVFEDGGLWRWLLDTDGEPLAEIDFQFGFTSDLPVVGDWDGDGIFNPGVARPEGSFYRWYFDSDFDPDHESGDFLFGGPFFNDEVVTGDWDNDGIWDVGVARPEDGFYRWLYDTNRDPAVESGDFIFGFDSDLPRPGDWNGDGRTDAGVVREDGAFLHWYLDTNRNPDSEADFIYGLTSHVPIVGSWQLSELRVQSDGADIATGHVFEMGNGLPGELPSSQSFTIQNIGNADLTLSGVSVPSGFNVTSIPASLAPGASHSVTVSVDNSVDGAQSGVLLFMTNDGNEEFFEIELREIVPEVLVAGVADGSSYDFGFAYVGQVLQKTFEVANTGTSDLNLGSPSLSGPFSLVGDFPTTIPAGATGTFVLNVQTGTSGDKSGAINFSTNDVSENPYDFDLFASVESPGQTVGGDTPAVMVLGAIDVGGTGFNEFRFDLNQDSNVEADRLFGLAAFNRAFAGDWNGDGSTDIGVVVADGANWRWFLDTDGLPDAEFEFIYGLTSDEPVVGDWNGDGVWNPGVARAENGFYRWLFDANFDPAVEDGNYIFGGPFFNDKIFTGDWNNDGATDVGVARPNGSLLRWYLDTNRDPAPEAEFDFGFPTDTPVPGDWDGDGRYDAGVARVQGNDLVWYLDSNRDPNAERTFTFGSSGQIPVVGNWSLSEMNLVNDADQPIPSETRIVLGREGGPSDYRFKLFNSGNADLTISDIQGPNGFNVNIPGEERFTYIVEPGEKFVFSVSLDRSVAGYQFGTLTFTTNDGNENPYAIHFIEAQPEIDIPQVADGRIYELGTGFIDEPLSNIITIRNTGDAALELGPPVINGPFSILGSFPSSIPADTAVNVTILVDTSSLGRKSGTLVFSNNDATENPYNISLRADVELRMPEIEIDDVASGGFYDFEVVGVNQVVEKTFVIRNLGSADLTFGTPVVIGNGFSCVSCSGGTLAPGQSASFTVRFSAEFVGDYTGGVSITNNDNDENPYSVSLRAEINQAPEIDVDEVGFGQTFDFGSTTEGAALQNTFTIRNLGTANLQVSAPVVSGAGFTCINCRGAIVAPGGTHSFTIRASANQIGVFSGSVSIGNNDANENPYTFNLMAEVEAAPEINVDIVPHQGGYSFGVVSLGANVSRTFTVENLGSADLVLTGFRLFGSRFSCNGCSFSRISPGGSKTFTITANTSQVGSFFGSLDIDNNDADEDPYEFDLSVNVANTIVKQQFFVVDQVRTFGSVSLYPTDVGKLTTFVNGETQLEKVFNGFERGLSTSDEAIDGLSVYFNRFYISTEGFYNVGGITGNGGDVIQYDPFNNSWTKYFDASQHSGLFSENVTAVHVGPGSVTFAIEDDGQVFLPGSNGTVIGDNKDLITYNFSSQVFSKTFDGSDFGFFQASEAITATNSLSPEIATVGWSDDLQGDERDVARYVGNGNWQRVFSLRDFGSVTLGLNGYSTNNFSRSRDAGGDDASKFDNGIRLDLNRNLRPETQRQQILKDRFAILDSAFINSKLSSIKPPLELKGEQDDRQAPVRLEPELVGDDAVQVDIFEAMTEGLDLDLDFASLD